MPIEAAQRRAWAEVDLAALTQNFQTIRRRLHPATKLCCVVKANAYGHGAIPVSRLFEALHADFLAVSNIEEALSLREAGIALPLLILGYTPPACAKTLARQNISQCVFSLPYAQALSLEAQKADVTIKIHIKLDTGMGRIGFRPFETEAIARASTLPAFRREGIFTHFASADEGKAGEAFTQKQLAAFLEVTKNLAKQGITFSLRHAANSAALLDFPAAELDMVRAGIVLYGESPSDCLQNKPVLSPALTLKTVVDLVKSLPSGETVSYGRQYTASGPRRIATLPIGYADGLRRLPNETTLWVSIGEGRAPVVGRICMDQCMIDVTDLPAVKEGDIVTVFGQGGQSAADYAALCGTIAYEILCAVGARVPRIYLP